MLSVELCRDLASAVDHCSSLGIYFRWLQVDQLYISSSGSLVVAGLSGAVEDTYEQQLGQPHQVSQHTTENKRRDSKDKIKLISSSVLANLETAAPEVRIPITNEYFSSKSY